MKIQIPFDMMMCLLANYGTSKYIVIKKSQAEPQRCFYITDTQDSVLTENMLYDVAVDRVITPTKNWADMLTEFFNEVNPVRKDFEGKFKFFFDDHWIFGSTLGLVPDRLQVLPPVGPASGGAD
jgi:hypothetical protein